MWHLIRIRKNYIKTGQDLSSTSVTEKWNGNYIFQPCSYDDEMLVLRWMYVGGVVAVPVMQAYSILVLEDILEVGKALVDRCSISLV